MLGFRLDLTKDIQNQFNMIRNLHNNTIFRFVHKPRQIWIVIDKQLRAVRDNNKFSKMGYEWSQVLFHLLALLALLALLLILLLLSLLL